VTGRINSIIPFFPFSPNEQAVVAHKFLLALQGKARLPINLKVTPPRFVGHCHVNILDDGKLCQRLAKACYTQQQGARSINNTVDKIRQKLVAKYLETDAEVTEASNKGPLEKYTVQLHPDQGAGGEVVAFRDGITPVEER
jgi:ATP-dependent Clp protease ATP-binding subunit ClpB